MKKLVTLFSLSALLMSHSVLAWTEHGLLTREALSVLKEIKDIQAVYEPLESLLPKMGLAYDKNQYGPATVGSIDAVPVKTPSDLNLYLQIKRDSADRHGFIFEPRLNEKSGQKLNAIDVLSHYADEPDGWHDHQEGNEPDTYLFEEGQYPNLWKNEYSMLGGKEGTASQAFRHMWWGPWSILHPLASLKLPLSMLKKSMGEADERMMIFLDLSRAAKKAGSSYWQFRFIANGLHFIQDCTQPFHVTQTASKKLIWMASSAGGWKGASMNMEILTKRTTQLVAYYHWSYEDLIGRIFKNPSKYPTAYEQFSQALKKSSKLVKVKHAGEYLQKIAKITSARSPISARTSIKFFPAIPKEIDLATFNPNDFMNDSWWSEVEVKAEVQTRVRRKYFNSVKESFELFGESVRSIVISELQ